MKKTRRRERSIDNMKNIEESGKSGTSLKNNARCKGQELGTDRDALRIVATPVQPISGHGGREGREGDVEHHVTDVEEHVRDVRDVEDVEDVDVT